jgi:ABC-2 type transport system ATP-binding protein
MGERTAVFQADALSKSFGSLQAVDAVSMVIPQGEIYGLVGPSGAGKTTLIRMLSGLAVPSAGVARLLGASMPFERRSVEDQFGYMPQERAVYRDLTIAENLLFFGQIYGMTRARISQRTKELLDLMKLSDRGKQRADRLSGGEKQRLSLACALLHEPIALLLDEPTIGLDPALRREFWGHFHQLRDAGRTILLSTHYLNEAEWCDRVGLVQRGRLVAEGTPDVLKQDAAKRGGIERPDMEQVFLILTKEPVAGGVS